MSDPDPMDVIPDEGPVFAVFPLLDLPENLFAEVLGFLRLKDRRRLFQTCQPLWKSCATLEGHVSELRLYKHDINSVADNRNSPILFTSQKALWSNHQSLRSLDLQGLCTDSFLRLISTCQLLPKLKHISMCRSQGVSDQGIKFLAADFPQRLENLESLDVTYCDRVTYEGTAILQGKLKNLRCIRRQPEWLDGNFYTPFGNDPNRVEVHTYWPDGSFSFTRAEQSRGCVVELAEWDKAEPNHVYSKLQYSNFTPPAHWPQLTRFCYRPGVSLWRLQDEKDEDGHPVEAVLVSQVIMGLRPPNRPELMKKAITLVPLGQTRYFDESGRVLVDDAANERRRHLMISKIRLVPLSPEQHSPPHDLVTQNLTFCRQRNCFATRAEIEESEEFLHTLLVGS